MVNSEPILRISGLSKSFVADDGSTVRALRGLSLTIQAGEFLALMGPNGAGKTTLLRIIRRLLAADEGEMFFAATDRNGNENGKGEGILYVPQDRRQLAFPAMSLEEHFLTAERRGKTARFWRRGITAERRERYSALLSRYGAEALVSRLSHPLASLSGGWQQVFVILMVVATIELGDAKQSEHILLLDEPVSNLDASNVQRCLDLIRRLHEKGYAILLATHDTELALELAQRVCIMRQGMLVADLPSDRARLMGVAGIDKLLRTQPLDEKPAVPPDGRVNVQGP